MKVGDYVRTKKRGFQFPQIAKIRSMVKDSGYHNQYYIELDHNLIPDYEFRIYEEDIDKSNPDIMELIQVGDYVNGCRVEENDGLGYFIILQNGKSKWLSFKGLVIKSIVTKEQFESMEYNICMR